MHVHRPPRQHALGWGGAVSWRANSHPPNVAANLGGGASMACNGGVGTATAAGPQRMHGNLGLGAAWQARTGGVVGGGAGAKLGCMRRPRGTQQSTLKGAAWGQVQAILERGDFGTEKQVRVVGREARRPKTGLTRWHTRARQQLHGARGSRAQQGPIHTRGCLHPRRCGKRFTAAAVGGPGN